MIIIIIFIIINLIIAYLWYRYAKYIFFKENPNYSKNHYIYYTNKDYLNYIIYTFGISIIVVIIIWLIDLCKSI